MCRSLQPTSGRLPPARKSKPPKIHPLPDIIKPTPIRWGILGTGRIVHKFIAAIDESGSGIAVASGSRNPESAAAFQADFPGLRCHPSYAKLLDDPEIDAVYVATPHPFHLEWATAALRRRIPVLCEKPLTMNASDTAEMIAVARANDCPLVEAFRYRFHPQTHRVCDLVREGTIGSVQQIHVSFGFSTAYDPTSRLFDPRLGASAILDVGCYPVSMARLIAGAAHGTAFENPIHVQGMLESLPDCPEVDTKAIANLRFRDGLLAQVRCGVMTLDHNTLEIDGTTGRIEVLLPWNCAPANEPAQISIHHFHGVESVEVISPLSAMAHEAHAFAELVRSGNNESPWMSWDDSLGNMTVLDLWRAAKG